MRARLSARVEASGRRDMVVSDAAAEELPFAEGSFDVVVSTLVLCSVSDAARALLEVHRVLRPGGELIYLEHVGAGAGSSLHRWQRFIEPVWKRLCDNCHLTRDTAKLIEASGFRLAHHIEAINDAGPEITGCMIRGRAVLPA